jgi:hypothetical protein
MQTLFILHYPNIIRQYSKVPKFVGFINNSIFHSNIKLYCLKGICFGHYYKNLSNLRCVFVERKPHITIFKKKWVYISTLFFVIYLFISNEKGLASFIKVDFNNDIQTKNHNFSKLSLSSQDFNNIDNEDLSSKLEDYLENTFYKVSWYESLDGISIEGNKIIIKTVFDHEDRFDRSSAQSIHNAVWGWLQSNHYWQIKEVSITDQNDIVIDN